MKIVNSDLDKKLLTQRVISVADAVAMNAVPEYWLSFKQAGLHLLALATVAKLFFAQLDLNLFANH